MTTNDFAFFGTPRLAVEILDELERAGYVPRVVVTTPDRPQGRGMEVRETPVALWARSHSIELLKPEKLDSGLVSSLEDRSLKLSVVVAYGKILPQALLDILPMYNIHYSLLPRWRGATPVESAILAGDTETGVSIQKIVLTLDAGPVVASEKTEIEADEVAPALRARLNAIAARLLVTVMPSLLSGDLRLKDQDESQVTTCGKIVKEDGHVYLSDDGSELYR